MLLWWRWRAVLFVDQIGWAGARCWIAPLWPSSAQWHSAKNTNPKTFVPDRQDRRLLRRPHPADVKWSLLPLERPPSHLAAFAAVLTAVVVSGFETAQGLSSTAHPP